MSIPLNTAKEGEQPTGVDLHPLLGLSPASTILSQHLSRLSLSASLSTTLTPQIKAYSDSVYFNYHQLGLSLVFHPTTPAYKPKTGSSLEQLDLPKLRLAQIDIYNHQSSLKDPVTAPTKRTSPLNPTYSAFPSYPLLLRLPASSTSSTTHFPLEPTTIGSALVTSLGEPDRKGGGEGSIGVWTEWTSEGVLVEWASGGLQAWEKGAGAVWRCTSLFERGVQMGKMEGEEDD
ncbi:hypothetical protein BCR35DRAFT_5633 [Leucosporidium creatinivorum]|uniref:Uncharacterized protein n=1 Tax=Leucosporidium creatinivorum TaxID=106004 RepID=A0A1Y2G3Z5_9BASI|nr:hypothetical protein BCR35DRAFT_5633 [Leucosporidium creatinivorum]